MRLIDADKLYKDLTNGLARIIGDGKDGKTIDACIIGKTIYKVFSAQPTAYDVDAVVKQLEEQKNLYKSMIKYEHKNGTVTEEYQARKAVEVLDRAIEIVKGGGVDETN